MAEKIDIEESISENGEIITEEKIDTNLTLGSKILKVIKIILLVITSPVWFPWKLLFVRRKGHKFSEVSTGKRVFRILRSPITKPLKFIVYMAIIGLEVLIVYKIRYSFLTYPITKNSVQNYYLKEESINSEHKDGFKDAFNKIDDWDIDTKNKMYVVMDSYIAKFSIENSDDKSIGLFLDKFNNDDNFRQDVHDIVKNIDKTVSRGIKEIAEADDSQEMQSIVGPVVNAGANVVDYRQALDILGNVVKVMDEDIELLNVDEESLEKTVTVFADYSRGASIEDLTKGAQ